MDVDGICSAGAGQLKVRLASGTDDIRAAQKLRWTIFYEECGARAPRHAPTGFDVDRYDDFCDHLLVIEESLDGDRVVGTYRVLRESVARRHGGFYTSGEYDLSPLLRQREDAGLQLLELGRSCVLPAYRTSSTIALLWRGIADYLVQHHLGLMIGCASFAGTDANVHQAALSYLFHSHLAPTDLRPVVHPSHRADVDMLPIGSYDQRLAFRALPPLIKGYLRVGAMVGEGVFVDRDFNTVDICMVMPVDRIAQRYATRFSAAA